MLVKLDMPKHVYRSYGKGAVLRRLCLVHRGILPPGSICRHRGRRHTHPYECYLRTQQDLFLRLLRLKVDYLWLISALKNDQLLH